MILADTSVWIDHFRHNDAALAAELNRANIAIHPFVIGEIALGSLRQRSLIIASLRDLPQLTIADDDEVLGLIEQRALFGLGIGFVDAHLVASVLLTPGSSLWTRDRRLLAVAESLAIAAEL